MCLPRSDSPLSCCLSDSSSIFSLHHYFHPWSHLPLTQPTTLMPWTRIMSSCLPSSLSLKCADSCHRCLQGPPKRAVRYGGLWRPSPTLLSSQTPSDSQLTHSASHSPYACEVLARKGEVEKGMKKGKRWRWGERGCSKRPSWEVPPWMVGWNWG